MAVTLTRNLKLRLDDNLTDNSRYNLERIDQLGAAFTLDNQETVNVRSKVDIYILPENASVGGSGVGGNVQVGTPAQHLEEMRVYADKFLVDPGLSLKDQAPTADFALNLRYDSTLSGVLDTADRTLTVDVEGADRELVLGANLSLQATSGNLILNLTGDTEVTLPLTGTLATLANPELLENKTLDKLHLDNGSFTTDLEQATSGQTSNVTLRLPPTTGTTGQVLQTDGAGNTSWLTVSGTGTVTSVGLSMPAEFTVAGSPVTSSGVLAVSKASQAANSVWAGPTTGGPASPTFRALVLADLPALSTTNVTEGTNLYFTDERAQDAIGGALTDSSSIDFTYDDVSNTITAVALPAGINHDALLNYAANRHVDHTAVSINTASLSGLAGGGDISASRSLTVNPTNATLKASPVAADELLISDSESSNALKKITLASLLASQASSGYATDWTSGTSFTATHALGTRDVLVELYDNTSFETIQVDSVVRTNSTTVDLTATQAPTGSGWRVLIKKVL